MTPLTLAAFAGAIFILFFTPGPGNVAMVARTLDAGPAHGFVYGGGIITGDIFWLTVAITGLSAAPRRPRAIRVCSGSPSWAGRRSFCGSPGARSRAGVIPRRPMR